MARASLSGSEPGADLSAWLAKIMARLSGSTAPSRAVYITTNTASGMELSCISTMDGEKHVARKHRAIAQAGFEPSYDWPSTDSLERCIELVFTICVSVDCYT